MYISQPAVKLASFFYMLALNGYKHRPQLIWVRINHIVLTTTTGFTKYQMVGIHYH